MISRSVRVLEQDEILPSWLSRAEGQLTFHPGGVTPQEIESINILVESGIIELASESVVDGALGLIESIQGGVARGQIDVVDNAGVGGDVRPFRVDRIRILAGHHEFVGQISVNNDVSGIDLHPLLIAFGGL